MIADLKIKLTKDPETGEERVPPEVMDILKRFNEHRELCSLCETVWKSKRGKLCTTGQAMVDDLLRDENVSVTNVRRP